MLMTRFRISFSSPEYVDVVAVAFAHFLAVDAGHGLCCSPDAQFGQLEDPPVRLELPEGFVHFSRPDRA